MRPKTCDCPFTSFPTSWGMAHKELNKHGISPTLLRSGNLWHLPHLKKRAVATVQASKRLRFHGSRGWWLTSQWMCALCCRLFHTNYQQNSSKLRRKCLLHLSSHSSLALLPPAKGVSNISVAASKWCHPVPTKVSQKTPALNTAINTRPFFDSPLCTAGVKTRPYFSQAIRSSSFITVPAIPG